MENNLGEITIPKSLLDGQLELILDDKEYLPHVRSNEKIWFITVEFNGTDTHTLNVIGTESVADNNTNNIDIHSNTTTTPFIPTNQTNNGCLIATAAYGSELAPQVQLLREIRDDSILQTTSGTTFMNAFNSVYYSFSPTVSDWQRENPLFNKVVQITITPLLGSLGIFNHVDIDSEAKMIGVGLGVIALNLGMYFVLFPAIAIVLVRKFRSLN